jgi:hypothetical protein
MDFLTDNQGGGLVKAMVTIAVVLVAFAAVSVQAQTTPTVGVYFDQAYTVMQKPCAGPNVMDYAYVVAYNFNAFLSGIEYMISYPPSVTWVADLDIPAATIGNTTTGISMGFATPRNGFGPVLIHRVAFLWQCMGCDATNEDDPFVVLPHPEFGFVRATDFPDFEFINGVGMTSLVCATVPVNETTWGKIKSLYEE